MMEITSCSDSLSNRDLFSEAASDANPIKCQSNVVELDMGINLLVVIVNYRSVELAIDCLSSLQQEVQSHPGTHVVVVENASGQDQVDRLRSEIDRRSWQGWVSLIEAVRNGGFAAGNNLAIDWALGWAKPPAMFWLLNPDTVVRPGALSSLSQFMETHPEIGLAGSRLEHPDGAAQLSAFRFPSILGELDGGLRFGPLSRLLREKAVFQPVASESHRADWVAGASLMIRREVFDQVGLLDERYFMYYEEVDFCRRAQSKGWACWYVPESRVVHLVGQSSEITSTTGSMKRRPKYWFDARKLYFLTHHGHALTFIANTVHVLAFACFRLRRRIQRKSDTDPKHFLWDLFRYNLLPARR